MMFLLRSAFCLALVVSWMPDPDGEVARTWRTAKSAAAAGVAGRAALTAAGDPKTPDAPRRSTKGLSPPTSANSLTAADLAPPWRGHRAKPRA
jgi:hypothetical protein